MKKTLFKRPQVLVPLIAVVLIVVIIAAVFIILSLRPKDSGLVKVAWEYFDGTVLDLGEWKGKLSGGIKYYNATLDDIDAFLDYLRGSELYDEKLEFKNSKSPFSTVIYIPVEGKLFYVRVMNNVVMISSLDTVYNDVEYVSKNVCRFMYSPVDTYGTHFQNPETKKYDSPGRWNADVTLDDIKYLYSFIDEDMYLIEDDCIYVRSYAKLADETSWALISIEKTGYSLKIYENEDGEVMVDVIYPNGTKDSK